MKNFKNKTVVISGGGSGIGKSIIQELYQDGTKQFAVIGRNLKRLENLKSDFPNAEFHLFKGDVSKPEDILAFVQTTKNKWSSIDILINNAGVVSAGTLESISDEDIIQQININTTGLILLTKHLLPLLKKSKEAAIINVASGIALIGLPFYTPYAASKGAVKMFSEALRRELKDFPIQVMTVYPTATDTPMMQTSVVISMDTPELVAQKTIEGLKSNDIDVILGDGSRLDSVKLNATNPQEFDKKVAEMYTELVKRTSKHRSM